MSSKEPVRPKPWTLIKDEQVFECPYFTTRRDQVRDGAGQPRQYHHVRMKNFGIAVMPIDREGHTILVGQQRYLLDKFTWEVVRGGGQLDVSALDSAKRELSEETGYEANQWQQIFTASASPGVTDEIALGFVAWDLREGAPHPDAQEDLLQWRLPFAAVVSMALAGTLADLASISLVLGIQLMCDRGQLPSDLIECLNTRRSS